VLKGRTTGRRSFGVGLDVGVRLGVGLGLGGGRVVGLGAGLRAHVSAKFFVGRSSIPRWHSCPHRRPRRSSSVGEFVLMSVAPAVVCLTVCRRYEDTGSVAACTTGSGDYQQNHRKLMTTKSCSMSISLSLSWSSRATIRCRTTTSKQAWSSPSIRQQKQTSAAAAGGGAINAASTTTTTESTTSSTATNDTTEEAASSSSSTGAKTAAAAASMPTTSENAKKLVIGTDSY